MARCMTTDRRDEITGLIFSVIAARAVRPGLSQKNNPLAHGSLVLGVQESGPISVEEIDYVLVQLCVRKAVNLIAGEIFLTTAIGDTLDRDRIDWLYGNGRFGTS
jgi:hypothetical protein